VIPPSKDYPWYTQECACESMAACNANAHLIQLYAEDDKEFEDILKSTLYADRKELTCPIYLKALNR
jgi:hypothetical protein